MKTIKQLNTYDCVMIYNWDQYLQLSALEDAIMPTFMRKDSDFPYLIFPQRGTWAGKCSFNNPVYTILPLNVLVFQQKEFNHYN